MTLFRSFLLMAFCLSAFKLFTQTDYQENLNKLNQTEDSIERLALMRILCNTLPLDSAELAVRLSKEAIAICKSNDLPQEQAFYHLRSGKYLLNTSQPNEAVLQFDTLLSLGKKHKLSVETAKGYHLQAFASMRFGKYKEAKAYLDSCLNILEINGGPIDLQYRSLFVLGRIQHKEGDYEKAVTTLNKVLEGENIDDFTKGQVISEIGDAHIGLGLYEKAIEYQLKSVSIFEEIGNSRELSNILAGLGATYIYLKQEDKAIEYFNKSLSIQESGNNVMGAIYSHINIASAEIQRANYSIAMTHLQKSLELTEQLGNEAALSTIKILLGYIYIDREDFTTAKQYYNEAIKLTKQQGRKDLQTVAFIQLADIANKEEDYLKAIIYGDSALSLAKSIKDRLRTYESLMQLSESHSQQFNFEEAYSYLEQASLYNDSLNNETSSSEIVRLESEHKIQKQEDEIAFKEKELALLIEQKELQADRFYLLLSTLLLSLLLAVYFIVSLRKKKRVNEEKLATKNKLLEYEKKLVAEKLKNEKFNKAQYVNQLNDVTEQLHDNKKELEKLEQDLDRIKSEKFSQLTKKNKSITETVLKISQSKQDWETFMEYFKENYHGYIERLQARFPDLNANELRLCALLKINLTTKEIAALLNITPASLRTSKYRLRKKLNLQEVSHISDFLIKF